MTVSWEGIAMFLIAGAISSGAFFLRKILKSQERIENDIIELRLCMVSTKTWREQHDKRHEEVGHRREEDRQEIWSAIDDIRKGKP